MRHNTVRLIVTLVLGILVAPLAAGAQQQAKVPRIGCVSSGFAASDEQRQRSRPEFIPGKGCARWAI